MVESGLEKQADEIFCPSCGQVIKRDARFCAHCGAAVSVAGPEAGPGYQTPVASAGVPQDVAGPGRYILNFVLAGLIGLLLTYLLRNQGWLATWICIPITVIAVIVFLSV